MAGEVITLECPKCRRLMPDSAREATDPPSAVRVVIICNRCDDGDFHEPTFFDPSGKEVPWHEGQDTAGRAALQQEEKHDR